MSLRKKPSKSVKAEKPSKKLKSSQPKSAKPEKISEHHLDAIAIENYKRYGVYVNEDRAIICNIDGLKPGLRRALWATHKMGLSSKAKHEKAAKVVGTTIGNYHPHGDCLDGETLVPLLSGKVVPIKDLVGSGSKWILAFDPKTNSVVPAKAHSWRIGQYTRKIYSIYLSDGTVVRCTGNHQFYSENNGWIQAKNLDIGEPLVGGTISDKYPVVSLTTGFSARIHNLSGKKFLGKLREGEVYHHINGKYADNRPKNLEILSRAEHAEHHRDYLKGLACGRLTMRTGEYRKAIAKKNSELMRTNNEWAWLLKAIKIVRPIMADNKSPSKNLYNKYRNLYNKYRTRVYNGTTLSRLEERGVSLKELVRISSPKHCLFIKDIVVENTEEKVPMYDFTVDGYENMLIATKDAGGKLNVLVTHNSAVFETIVKATTSTAIPLFDGEGNWGTMTDPAAAQRYVNTRLSKYSDAIFFDRFYLPVIDYVPNYDGSEQEPLVLPALLPNALLNGGFGIGVGTQSNCPSYTLSSVLKMLKAVAKGEEITYKVCRSLDFVSGYGGVVDRVAQKRENLSFLKTGKGKLKFDSLYEHDEKRKAIRINKFAPVSYSNLDRLLAKVENLKCVQGRVVDDSRPDDPHMKAFVIHYKRNLKGKELQNAIKSIMEVFSANESFDIKVTLRSKQENGLPKAELSNTTIPEIVKSWWEFRLDLEKRACTYWIGKCKEEIARLEVLLLAINCLDYIVSLLKNKKLSEEEIASKLSNKLKITVAQANVILDMKVRQLRSLNGDVMKKRIAEIKSEIEEYRGRIKKPAKAILNSLVALEKQLCK